MPPLRGRSKNPEDLSSWKRGEWLWWMRQPRLSITRSRASRRKPSPPGLTARVLGMARAQMPARSHLQAHNFIIDAVCRSVIQLQLRLAKPPSVTCRSFEKKTRVLSRSPVKLMTSVKVAGERHCVWGLHLQSQRFCMLSSQVGFKQAGPEQGHEDAVTSRKLSEALM